MKELLFFTDVNRHGILHDYIPSQVGWGVRVAKEEEEWGNSGGRQAPRVMEQAPAGLLAFDRPSDEVLAGSTCWGRASEPKGRRARVVEGSPLELKQWVGVRVRVGSPMSSTEVPNAPDGRGNCRAKGNSWTWSARGASAAKGNWNLEGGITCVRGGNAIRRRIDRDTQGQVE